MEAHTYLVRIRTNRNRNHSHQQRSMALSIAEGLANCKYLAVYKGTGNSSDQHSRHHARGDGHGTP